MINYSNSKEVVMEESEKVQLREEVDRIVKQKGQTYTIEYLCTKLQNMHDFSFISNHSKQAHFDSAIFSPKNKQSPQSVKHFSLDELQSQKQPSSSNSKVLQNSQLSMFQQQHSEKQKSSAYKRKESLLKREEKLKIREHYKEINNKYMKILKEMQISLEIYHQCLQQIIFKFNKSLQQIIGVKRKKSIKQWPLEQLWKEFCADKKKCLNFEELASCVQKKLAQNFLIAMSETEQIVKPEFEKQIKLIFK